MIKIDIRSMLIGGMAVLTGVLLGKFIVYMGWIK